jgi:hypothetical protein
MGDETFHVRLARSLLRVKAPFLVPISNVTAPLLTGVVEDFITGLRCRII